MLNVQILEHQLNNDAVTNYLLDEAPFGFAVLDEELRFLYVNDKLARINGASVQDHIGTSFQDILPNISSSLIPILESVLKTGAPVTFELRQTPAINNPNILHDWLCCYYPARDANHRICGIACTVSDVSHLNETEHRLQVLSDNMLDIVSLHKPGGTISWISPSCETQLGYAPNELVGTDPYKLIHPDDRERIAQASSSTGQGLTLQYRVVTKSGEIKWFEALSNFVRNEDGEITAVQVCSRDVTERVRARTALKESEQRLAVTIDALAEGLILRGADGKIILHNTAAAEMLSLDLNRLDTTPADHPDLKFVKDDGTLVPKDEFPFYKCLYSGRSQFNVVMHAVTPGRPEQWFSVNSEPLFREGESFPYAVVSTTRDITEQKRIEQERVEQRSAAQMQWLSDRLIAVQESERRKIAADLHDEIGGSLTGLKLLLEMSKTTANPAVAVRLEQATSLVQDIIGNVRQMSMDLRPSILDHSGLIPALEWYFKRYSSQTGIRITFRKDKFVPRFRPEIEVTLYRIIQEALTNIARYAGVNRALVSVTRSGGAIKVSVRDQGRGFDLDTVRHRPDAGGLAGMRERLRLVGGRFDLKTSPGQGTRITAELPVENDWEVIQ